MNVLKAQIIQDGMRRAKKHWQRENERKHREENRREEQLRKSKDVRRYENTTHMMIVINCKGIEGN